MSDRRAGARSVLAANRRDGYTVPSPSLYPYQWNWDSAFVAIGLSTVDPDVAKRELRTLFGAVHDDGLLPHICFHDETAAGYFPGPEEWGRRTDGLATSGITQPPVAVTATRVVFERTGDRALLADVLPAVRRHLRWWTAERAPEDLVYVRHPWETGMDDSPAWDAPLARIDPEPGAYDRADLDDPDAERERPPDWYYDRYVHLLRQGRRHDWDEERLRDVCPFRVEDVLTNAAFVRACEDLAVMLDAAGDAGGDRWRDRAEAARAAARDRLWDPDSGTFRAYDRVAGERLRPGSVAGPIATFGGLPTADQAGRLADRLRAEFLDFPTGVPTYVGEDVDPRRYWRGPVWANTNWLLARGLDRYGLDLADRVRADTLALVEDAGFHEYFDPRTGDGLGSDRFAWTAACYLDLTGDAAWPAVDGPA